MMKKRILVTGGAGFVGSHLCERLAQNETMKFTLLTTILQAVK
jgi:nucleoside-diphosphate-sugar epimerase